MPIRLELKPVGEDKRKFVLCRSSGYRILENSGTAACENLKKTGNRSGKESKRELYFHSGAAEITLLPFERKTAFSIGKVEKEKCRFKTLRMIGMKKCRLLTSLLSDDTSLVQQ
ncbi:MAG: hypothetical protein ACLSA6_09655 [Holdemania massiliensis]